MFKVIPLLSASSIRGSFPGIVPRSQYYDEEAKGKKIGNPWVGRERGLEPKKEYSGVRLTWTSGHGLLTGGDRVGESFVPSSSRPRCLTTMQHLTGKPLEKRKG